ncbi:MAG: hypothetical protein HUT38_04665 [Candidatus Paceibacter sp.]|nr:hypothetical protein [Candidatus Paceibacter sp.]
MKLIFRYKNKDRNELEDLITEAYKDVSAQFQSELDDLCVRVHNNKKDFNKQIGRETESWHVASATKGEVDIMHFDAFEKETSHKKEDFLPILKHEITHLFIEKITRDKAVPKWLSEGLSSYVSKQYKNIKHPVYVEENFCEKLGTPAGWDKHSNYYAYNTAALFVGFLAEKYSLNKLIELLSNINKNYFYPDFIKKFETVFGKTLNETEKIFVNEINK